MTSSYGGKKITLDFDNSISIAKQFIEVANSKGAFQLKEGRLLSQACDYFDSNITDKPVIKENDPTPDATALGLIVQGVNIGQLKGSYTLKDAALLADVVDFLTTEGVLENRKISKKAAHIGSDDEDEEIDIKHTTLKGKNKART